MRALSGVLRVRRRAARPAAPPLPPVQRDLPPGVPGAARLPAARPLRPALGEYRRHGALPVLTLVEGSGAALSMAKLGYQGGCRNT